METQNNVQQPSDLQKAQMIARQHYNETKLRVEQMKIRRIQHQMKRPKPRVAK